MITPHTTGPWVCHSGMVWKPDNSTDGYPIAKMDRDTPKTTPTERDANARLIAAAPDLLNVCQRLARHCEQNSVPELQGIACECFAAIKKATT